MCSRQASPTSAQGSQVLHVERYLILSFPCPACFLPAWRRWLRVSFWVCAHFRGSCGSVRGRDLFPRSWCRSWAFSSGTPDAGWGGEGRLATLRTWWSSTSASTFPEIVYVWWSSSWWPPCWRRAFTGAGSVALGRLLHVRGSGNGMWCHDEAHRTRHHRLHEERSSRLQRTLTTRRMFSFCGVLRGAGLILALRSGFALSTFVRGSFRCHFLHFSSVADTCDALTLSSIPCVLKKKTEGEC